MSRVLVAYFSATGTTKRLAESLAKAARADLFEIRPSAPYSAADLDWTNDRSRSSIEMNDPLSRPAIAELPADIESYDTVFVGFPIWWYVAPHIVNSFLEACDFSGKDIVLFATSGGSGMGSTLQALEGSAPGARWLSERCFGSGASEEELKRWVGGILN